MKITKLTRLLNMLGLKLAANGTNNYSNEVTYQSKTIQLPVYVFTLYSDKSLNKERQRIINDVCHEIGHYLLASPRRRKLKDYGIPSYRVDRDDAKWDLDEAKAYMIQNELSGWLGFRKYKTPRGIRKNMRKPVLKWWNDEGRAMIKMCLSLVE